jgi:hypothetical protein
MVKGKRYKSVEEMVVKTTDKDFSISFLLQMLNREKNENRQAIRTLMEIVQATHQGSFSVGFNSPELLKARKFLKKVIGYES